MQNDPKQNDKSEYLNTGFRDQDGREGFGDDGGARVGRPDGAGSNASAQDPNQSGKAHEAPLDASGPPRPGQAGTNAGPVDGGIEGSLIDDGEGGAQGDQQSRIQEASEGVDMGKAAGDERPTYNL
jgi:hypothetical protein